MAATRRRGADTCCAASSARPRKRFKTQQSGRPIARMPSRRRAASRSKRRLYGSKSAPELRPSSSATRASTPAKATPRSTIKVTPRKTWNTDGTFASIPVPPSPRPAVEVLTPRQQYDLADRLSRRRRPSDTPTFSLTSSASSQSLGVRRSAPSFGFGAASRDVANKVFISQQHTLTIRHGLLSPGPAYYKQQPSVGGKQADGSKPDPPVWRFNKGPQYPSVGKETQKPGPTRYTIPIDPGRSASFGAGTREAAQKLFVSQAHTLTTRAGTQSPGPKYVLPSGVGGKQPSARMRDGPSWHLSGRARAPVEPGLDTPGAKYHLPRAHGIQPDSGHRSEPLYSIGGTARTPVEPGLDTPGAKYHLPSALGRQPRAHPRMKSAPTPAFSRYSRWADLEREQRLNTVPGPGHYG